MNLRKVLKRAGPLSEASEARVRVLVELRMRSPKESDIDHLSELGLQVERVIENKVVGSIPSEKLAELERDPSVHAVERSRKMKLH